ncbi:unnamed protein product [Meganyctiphanes norvegica]|uniref:Uncharacterized protein n=1 Tax=Meganyctiphanes norvegica TaxID=48144 RepID=A0AAV2QC84_MEGNR
MYITSCIKCCKNSVKELHMYEDIEDFVQDLYTFFSFHVEFADIFSDLQDTFDIVKHRLIQYSEVFFLSIYKVVVRCIEQYKSLKELFLITIPKYHSKVRKQCRVRRITDMMKYNYTLPTLHFMAFSLKIYQIYELFFQKN